MSLNDFKKKCSSCERFACSTRLIISAKCEKGKELSKAWTYLVRICLNKNTDAGRTDGIWRGGCVITGSMVPTSQGATLEAECCITHLLCCLQLYATSYDYTNQIRNWRTSFPSANLLYWATDVSESLCSVWSWQGLKNLSLCRVLVLNKASIRCEIGSKPLEQIKTLKCTVTLKIRCLIKIMNKISINIVILIFNIWDWWSKFDYDYALKTATWTISDFIHFTQSLMNFCLMKKYNSIRWCSFLVLAFPKYAIEQVFWQECSLKQKPKGNTGGGLQKIPSPTCKWEY